MRPTSSTRSISRVRSEARSNGITARDPVHEHLHLAAQARRGSRPTRRPATSTPSDARRCARSRTASVAGSGSGAWTSSVPGDEAGAAELHQQRLAIAIARGGRSGGRPFSKRPLDSLRRPRAREVLRIVGPSKVAASSSTRVVPAETSANSAAEDPRDHRGALGVADREHRASRACAPAPSSVVIGSPSPRRAARRSARRRAGRGRRRAAAAR